MIEKNELVENINGINIFYTKRENMTVITLFLFFRALGGSKE